MNRTWLIIGIVIFVISVILATLGGYKKYKNKNPSSTYTALFWSGIIAGVLSIGLIIAGVVMKSQIQTSY
jgi:O-antigen ligase